MEIWIYTFLLLLMLFFLYKAGEDITKTGETWSFLVILGVLAYTLNEGLRFGRGIDYNLYGMDYEELEETGYSEWDISFQYIARALISLDIPWQGYVLLMSFVFIVSTLMLLRNNYRDVLPLALPLFVLFSKAETENMVRWYMGFSFILVGLTYLLEEEENYKMKFWCFSAFACTFHLALLPLPFVFYFLTLRKSTLLSPIWVLVLYFGIALFFQTDFMMYFLGMANILTATVDGYSERFTYYSDNAEYWLTGGFAGVKTSAFPSIQEVLYYCCLVLGGYKAIEEKGNKYVFAYNMLVVGLLTNPLARQIELLSRFNQPFMFFQAIVLACIIQYVFVEKSVEFNQLLWLLSLLLILNMGRKILVTPFSTDPEKYLYVWDSEGRSYQSMYDTWIGDMYNADAKKKRQE